uniref:CSON005128 protein n=1 Tax=Culicoides sonorensis TaxID=179676 RepID=A0A336MPU0_CULSO
MTSKLNVFGIHCLFLVIVNIMTQSVSTAPQNAYNYANKAIRGASPIEDHSQHLAHVAAAVQQTDLHYNNNLDPSTLQQLPRYQTGLVQEQAAYEVEHPDSAVRTKYENTHKFVNNYKGQKPLIDRIQEHEKYGNNGDQFYFFTRGLVNGYQKFADVLNGIIEGTGVKFTGVTRGFTEQLDQIGAKIVGL